MARNPDIDIAKGIGILLVMGLHSGFHQQWMATFEMPLFFLLSGVFFKADLPFKQFLMKKVNTLLIPYIFFESPKLVYDLWYFLSHDSSLIDCYVNSSLPTTTWFILCLFEIQLISYAIFKVSKKIIWLASVALLFSIAGYWLSRSGVDNFLFLCSAVTGTSFFLLGYLAKSGITARWKRTFLIPLGGIMLMLCHMIWSFDKPDVFYRGNMLDDYWSLVIAMALAGSTGVILISKSIRSRFLQFFGRYSLIILGTHLYIFVTLERINANLPPIVLFTTGVLLEIPIIIALRKYMPRFCGILPLLKNNIPNVMPQLK